MQNHNNLHDKDFYAWTKEQAYLLQNHQFEQLDIEHLYEEIESMGNQNKTELRNRLTILVMYLLKWKYQPDCQGKSWYITIVRQRVDITDLIEDNPSLKHILKELFEKAYHKAIILAVAETGITKNAFPSCCEWEISQVLNNEFFPNH